ncbi:MAG: ABC transporter permease [Reyranellaceae bacterium]
MISRALRPAWLAGLGGGLCAIAFVVALWAAMKYLAGLPSHILPAPTAALRALADGLLGGEFWPHIGATLGAAAIGYLIGATVAIALAALLTLSKSAERFLYLHIVAFQSIPKIALAPLIFIWAGFGISSSITLVALACFYPVFVNALIGFRAVDANLIDLYIAFGSSRLRIFTAVRLPSAAAQILTGLEVSIVFALIAAVVMEFVSSRAGLGYLIQNASTTLETATVFAVVLLLAIAGIAAAATVRLVRRRLVFWERDRGGQGAPILESA